jgi:hypothetical protein
MQVMYTVLSCNPPPPLTHYSVALGCSYSVRLRTDALLHIQPTPASDVCLAIPCNPLSYESLTQRL